MKKVDRLISKKLSQTDWNVQIYFLNSIGSVLEDVVQITKKYMFMFKFFAKYISCLYGHLISCKTRTLLTNNKTTG